MSKATKAKKTAQEETQVQFRAAQSAQKFISDYTVPLFVTFGIWAALTKSVGAANFAFPPKFSIGYWFDDLFGTVAVFCTFFFVSAAESIKWKSEKLACIYAALAWGITGALASFAKDRVSLAFTIGFAAIAALQVKTIQLLSSAGDSEGSPAPAGLGIPRLVMLINGGFFIAAGVARMVFGIDKNSVLPDQPQVRLAAPFAIITGILTLRAALGGRDLHFIRAGLLAGMTVSFWGSGLLGTGSLRSEPIASAVQWTMTTLLAANVYAYSQPAVCASLLRSLRSFKRYVGNLSNSVSEGYGDE